MGLLEGRSEFGTAVCVIVPSEAATVAKVPEFVHPHVWRTSALALTECSARGGVDRRLDRFVVGLGNEGEIARIIGRIGGGEGVDQ